MIDKYVKEQLGEVEKVRFLGRTGCLSMRFLVLTPTRVTHVTRVMMVVLHTR